MIFLILYWEASASNSGHTAKTALTHNANLRSTPTIKKTQQIYAYRIRHIKDLVYSSQMWTFITVDVEFCAVSIVSTVSVFRIVKISATTTSALADDALYGDWSS